MNVDKIREKDTAVLEKDATDMHESMFRIKFQMSLGQTDGLKKYREMKKDRARILTVLRERAK
ncbi:MAG: 50S ribosomal protein L29 [Acidimicrobiia bacterium]|jgi:large subunit ribosomal protein L29|nr:50S ribosomal protein L29 [Acidimicrobiia bacterium]